MEVFFRTDASLNIGSGHVMRCLTLADVLKNDGAQCHFICREHPGNLIALIREKGFQVSTLSVETETSELASLKVSRYSSWLGADWQTDAEQTRKVIGSRIADWLIVDHYAIDQSWEHVLRSTCNKLMVIDDLADRTHDCDLLLDQNLGREVNDYKTLVPQGCKVLVGPHYALLRPEFADMREYSLNRRSESQLRHTLIIMGGVDQNNATGRILKALKSCPHPDDMRITVVMGVHAPWLSQVRALAAQMSVPTEVKVNVIDMAQLMAESDLAIGAAGSTSWERCCLGLPTLILVLAENQRQGAAALEKSGSAIVLDDMDLATSTLEFKLTQFMSAGTFGQMSQSSSLITDGKGAGRVQAALSGYHA